MFCYSGKFYSQREQHVKSDKCKWQNVGNDSDSRQNGVINIHHTISTTHEAENDVGVRRPSGPGCHPVQQGQTVNAQHCTSVLQRRLRRAVKEKRQELPENVIGLHDSTTHSVDTVQNTGHGKCQTISLSWPQSAWIRSHSKTKAETMCRGHLRSRSALGGTQ